MIGHHGTRASTTAQVSAIALRPVTILTTALAAILLALFCWAPRASADLSFCPPGSGAGQCANPAGIGSLRGLAVDFATGRVYVADSGNNRVDVFAEDGTFIFAFGWKINATTPEEKLQTCTAASGCQKGAAGTAPGQLTNPGRIAVDNDPTSPSQHAVYVAEDSCVSQPSPAPPCTPNHRVQKFDATGAFLWAVGSSGEAEGQFSFNVFPGVGPGGILYVLDNPKVEDGVFKYRLQHYLPDGTPIAPQCFALKEGSEFKGGRTTGFAVEAGGDFWAVGEGGERAIRKYDANCAPLLSEKAVGAGIETKFLTLDAAGSLFAKQGEGLYQVITTYNGAGDTQRRFGYGRIPTPGGEQPEGLAVGAAGTFISVGEAGVKLLTPDPPGPIISPVSLQASPLRARWAAIKAEVNPEGKPTKYEVQYVDQHSYETEGGFASPHTRSGGELELGAADFSLHPVEATAGCKPFSEGAYSEGKCLTPETTYRYRLIAKNEDGANAAEGEFTTLKAIEIEATWASDAGTDTATLNAEVDPVGAAATGYFQYIDEAGYEAGIQAAEAEGKSRAQAEAEGRGFDSALKAPDVGAGAAPIAFDAGEGALRRRAALYPLAPGTTYHYRLIATDHLATLTSEERTVTTFKVPQVPPCPANEAFRLGPAALLPDCRAYELVSPLDKGGADIRVLVTTREAPATLEQSADSGDKLAFGSVRAFGDAASAPVTSQYVAQRVDGAEWQTHSINSPRGKPLVGVLAQADTEFKFFSPDLCDAWQITYAEPPLASGGVAKYKNLYRRSDRLCGPEAYEALAPLASPPGQPPGVAFGMELQGLSADGSHAIFLANGKLAPGGVAGQPMLYESVRGVGLRLVCVTPGGAALAGTCSAGTGGKDSDTRTASVTGAISADGQRIYWSENVFSDGKLYLRIGGTQTLAVSKVAEAAAGTSTSFFWGASTDGGRAVFTTGGRLYAFTLAGESTQLLADGAQGVMGISEDARRIYFASDQALAGSGANSEGDVAIAGQSNLYLYDAADASTTFIATLAGADSKTELRSVIDRSPRFRAARVTPDGAHAAFTSLASPTGYDNADAESGTPVKELYLYDAVTGKLICASCNPSGARPVSAPSLEAANGFKAPPFAARIPGFETQMHAARVLSDDGARLYFESPDRLSPRDTNGAIDVYQWEAPGSGTCTTSSSQYSSQNEGCIELISSGQSPIDSSFVEASPDGRDVFFATLSGLLPQDPGLIDIYDARVGGGLPIPAGPAPSCEGEACQSPPASPNDPTPASSSFKGAGNVVEPAGAKRCPKGKVKVRRKGKTRCLADRRSEALRKHNRHNHRANRNRRAAR